jgi:hypothetical protein
MVAMAAILDVMQGGTLSVMLSDRGHKPGGNSRYASVGAILTLLHFKQYHGHWGMYGLNICII